MQCKIVAMLQDLACPALHSYQKTLPVFSRCTALRTGFKIQNTAGGLQLLLGLICRLLAGHVTQLYRDLSFANSGDQGSFCFESKRYQEQLAAAANTHDTSVKEQEIRLREAC